MKKLLLVSNRLPVTIEKRKGEFSFQSSVGGLATGLGSFYRKYDSRWIGWCGIPQDNLGQGEKRYLEEVLLEKFNCYTLHLSKTHIKNFYNGFCNQTIWPILLYFQQYARYDRIYWEHYQAVNRMFGDTVLKLAGKDEIIWIHDYHLMLLPQMIRERMPEARIGFFLHTSFPSLEIFRLLPWRKELLEGLLGADLIGFHTYDYVRHFLSTVHRLLGYDCTLGKIATEERLVRVDTFPIGIDYARYAEGPGQPEIRKNIGRWRNRTHGKKVILSVDRLDYTKNIPHRLKTFDKFLEKFPEFRGKVIYILLAVPSRQQLEYYKQLKRQTDELVGSINGKYGTMDWMPIWYLYRSLPFRELVALYAVADIAVVTSMRDGMNLVAKEFLAVKTDSPGVLILSETTGAVKELGESLIVNPNSADELTETLKTALTMSEEEQIQRNRIMQKRLKRFGIVNWAEDFIARLEEAKSYQRKMRARLITPGIKAKLLDQYRRSRKRLLLLDYDGTLVRFYGRPEEAAPDKKLLNLVSRLAKNPCNEVVIISGRDRHTLDDWFGSLGLNMSAEHGGWIKEWGREWEMLEAVDDAWKKQVRPLLQTFEDRTPGSILEEKAFSLVWHYRMVDSQLGLQRVVEIIDELSNLSEKLSLQVARGDKVVEVKKAHINKGRVALRWTSREKWNFILAAGDSWTDEDIFAVLPEEAVSIKVGLSPSQARYNLDSPEQLRKFLTALAAMG